MAKFEIFWREVFIDRALEMHGRVNRSDLQNTFGISAQQASKDLTAFCAKHPHRIYYCPRTKAYLGASRPVYSFRTRYAVAVSIDAFLELSNSPEPGSCERSDTEPAATASREARQEPSKP